MRTGFWFFDGDFDHGAEIVVVLAADADVAGIDAVFRQRAGALGILLEQNMAVVMEVADDGHAHAELVELSTMWGTAAAASSVLTVTRTSSEPARASAAPVDGAGNIGRVGVGHGLHHDRRIRADTHIADGASNSFPAMDIGHGKLYFITWRWLIRLSSCSQPTPPVILLPYVHARRMCSEFLRRPRQGQS